LLYLINGHRELLHLEIEAIIAPILARSPAGPVDSKLQRSPEIA
jgi:hypothetical protein